MTGFRDPKIRVSKLMGGALPKNPNCVFLFLINLAALPRYQILEFQYG